MVPESYPGAVDLRFWRKKPRSVERASIANAHPTRSVPVNAPKPVSEPPKTAKEPPAKPRTSPSAPAIEVKPEVPDVEAQALIRKVKMVIAIWEGAQRHELSRERMHEFRKRPEIAELIEFDRVELELCADLSMKLHGGQLLLSDWLALAFERKGILAESAERRPTS